MLLSNAWTEMQVEREGRGRLIRRAYDLNLSMILRNLRMILVKVWSSGGGPTILFVVLKITAEQGCSVRFFGSKGLIKFVNVLEPSNCLSSSMCNFEMKDFAGFRGHTRPKHACIVLIYRRFTTTSEIK